MMYPEDKKICSEEPPEPSRDIENLSNLEKSDDDLEIDLDSTIIPQNSSPTHCNAGNNIIDAIEDEIEKQLTEKAEKTNLTVKNVKSIIRHVLTNDHVKALLDKDGNKLNLPRFEPKLTRAKTKELLSANTLHVQAVNITWVPQPPPSETQVLIGEDLKEDDSGDEYVPGEEESEDDRDGSVASESDVSSLPPPTPPAPICTEDHATQTTTYTDDGVFKIPPPKQSQEQTAEEAANIAFRTRSKINLSSTPLEVIEKSFVPPDVTTDMYEMDCDDEEWKEFLKGFTQPLDEVTKPTEDDEHDPEYNIMADDEINQIDNEDFRVDKAVKITKKEVKQLWDELFEYLHSVTDEYDDKNNETNEHELNEALSHSYANLIQDDSQIIEESQIVEESQNLNVEECRNSPEANKVEDTIIEDKIDINLSYEQICIMQQQVRQHVQMLTQNFLLTYEHPEFHHYSSTCKEYLLNLKFLSEKKIHSFYKPVNLMPALELIDSWVEMYSSNCEVIQKTREHVQQQLAESIRQKMAGNWTYVMEFPELILQTVSKSDVFSYPFLLPKIPFKSEQFSGGRTGFTDSEDWMNVHNESESSLSTESIETASEMEEDEHIISETMSPLSTGVKRKLSFKFSGIRKSLLMFGYDEFKKFLSLEKKTVTMKEVISYVQEYIMPHRNKQTIQKHIIKAKDPRCATNPIQQYMLYGKLKPFIHYIMYPLNQNMPPCRRMAHELPIQWRNFIYPTSTTAQGITNIGTIQSVQNVFSLAQPQQVIQICSPIGITNLLTSPVVLVQAETNADCSRGSTRKTRTSLLKTLNSTQQRSNSINKASDCRISQPPGRKKCKPRCRSGGKANNKALNTSQSTIEHFVSIFLQPIGVQKLVRLLTYLDINKPNKQSTPERVFVKTIPNMLPNMPSLNTPMKDVDVNRDCSGDESGVTSKPSELTNINENNTGEARSKCETTTSTPSQDNRREKLTKNLEFSTITVSSFQQSNSSTEVEFCRDSNDIQICQTSQFIESASASNISEKNNASGKSSASIPVVVVKPEVKSNVRKELSGAEKKKNKLRKEFLANLSMATPDDPETEKHKNEMFAIAYYDKLRETLDFDEYHKIMQVINDFGTGDVVDLYNDVQAVLRPKYMELAEEFLFFLREKEAHIVGQLIPWLELQARVKFLRKLEVFFKDQPAQLKKIYNALLELTKTEDLTMEKVKSVLMPMLKGNNILIDLFLQNFRDERPPSSLLEGPYETIDLNKELARPNNEDLFETLVVPNTEDHYGGQNCICHCHKIEDNEYKSRYKHCTSCGLKFANGMPYLANGRVFQPATVTFKTSPHVNHNVRLLGKSAATSNSGHRKKRSDASPNKVAASSGKENLEEDTEDEEIGKRKRPSQKTPRKRKKNDPSKYQENARIVSPKKSHARNIDPSDNQKDTRPRKRTYSGRKSRKEEMKKIQTERENTKVEDVEVQAEKPVNEDFEIIAEIEESEHETNEEQTEKVTDDCMDSSGESIEKPLTPGQQTAESESEIYLEESSQDNYESDESSSSTESTKGSQSDSNTNDEPPWRREEDTAILETLQKEDDKEYALQIISDKLPNRTVGQIRNRLFRLMDLLIETVKNS